jgi:hypothetical protein
MRFEPDEVLVLLSRQLVPTIPVSLIVPGAVDFSWAAMFVEKYRNHDNGNRQGEEEMNMPVEGIGRRDAKKP